MSIGDNIKKLRKQNKMKQEDLAALLFVSNRTVSSWECDRTEPKMGMIDKMSKIFGCKKTDIINVTPDVDFSVDGQLFVEQLNEKRTSKDRLLDAYQSAPDAIKKAIDKLLDLEKEE